MAIPIKDIPVLKGKEAHAFLVNANKSYQKRKTVDFTAQSAICKRILQKAKL